MSGISYGGNKPIDGDFGQRTEEHSGQQDTGLGFDDLLTMRFYDDVTNHASWETFATAADQDAFTHPDGSQMDQSLRAHVNAEVAYPESVMGESYLEHSSQSIEADGYISALHTRSGSGANPSERSLGNTFNSLVAPKGEILASSARWVLSKDIPPPGSVAPIAYCTLERFSRWLSEHEPYLPQATAERLADPGVREQYNKNRQLYAFIRWAAKVSNSTDDVPDRFCFLCFEAVGIFYPQSQRTKGVTCACDFIKMGRRSEFGIAESRKYTPHDGCDSQQQSGLAPSQRASLQMPSTHEIYENPWPSYGALSDTSSIFTGSGPSLSRRSSRAPCSLFAPTGVTKAAKSKPNTRSKSREPGFRKSGSLVQGYSRYLALIKPFEIAPTPEELKQRANRKEHKVKDPKGFIAWAATESGHTNDFKGTICWECFEYTGKFHPKRTRNDDAACRCESVTQATLWKFQDNAKVGTLRFPIYAFEGTAEKHQVLANRTIVTVATCFINPSLQLASRIVIAVPVNTNAVSSSVIGCIERYNYKLLYRQEWESTRDNRSESLPPQWSFPTTIISLNHVLQASFGRLMGVTLCAIR
ncbi:hypothetical protein HD553DRAFT_323537 [Filobasidium floriforme]|uniref:uncharacterized protein n=1 Tax=Filobasidium floriforme TaxID=5210 RepID=UPI001E8E4E9D|nr:uncharacterized protein HD553DRAFT_323537 [Filobasidium floriforme]KAH8085676.1 hypothetical protein HD553DRAFT_323537 [Filobasidium floriforme]